MKNKRFKIKSWLQNVISDNSWEKYNDLHIDEIDAEFRRKNTWLAGGLECYNEAAAIISDLAIPFTVELAFALKSKKNKKDHIITNIKSLEKEFSDTPPSLYIFRNDWAGLNGLKEKGTVLKSFLEDKKLTGEFYYYQSFHEQDAELRRVVYYI